MFEDKTPEAIKTAILEAITMADTREGSYTNDMVSPLAVELWKLYDSLNALIPIVYVDETSGEYIDKKAAHYGISRKPGAKAYAMMHFAGTDGTIISKGTVFLTLDGLEFETAAAVTISGGTASITASAADIGEIYNVAAGTITQQLVSISGLNSIYNDAAVGGIDPESDASLVKRLYDYLQKPATSGNKHHYEQWALEVPGVGAAKVYPLWAGPGTVKVLIVGHDKSPVDSTVVGACAAHIEQLRPIGAIVTVASAEGLEINVEAEILIESTTTREAVSEAFESSLAAYLKAIAFDRYEIIYNRIAFMLLDIEGVVDYTSLTVNGGTENIIIDDDQVPIAGTVVIS